MNMIDQQDDDMEDVQYDRNAELRRHEEEARRFLLSKPVNRPKADR